MEPVEALLKYARSIADSSPLTAELMRRSAGDDDVLGLLPADVTWDVPHRLVAAVDWLVLDGRARDYHRARDPWSAFRAAARDHAQFVGRFVREQPVQTNEVQRCFALLPVFLSIARVNDGLPLDLVELGASAGLNLLVDRYRYRYARGTWGRPDAALELSGEERAPVPGDLLEQPLVIRRRVGVDLRPLDVRREEDVRLLRVFSAEHRHPRLEGAVAIARRDPPPLVAGDYLEILPGLLERRDDGALTVVFQTLSTVYLDDGQRARLREIIDAAGGRAPLAYVGTPTPEEHGQRRGDYPIELCRWPEGEQRIVARMNNHGEWLEWLG